MGLREGPTPTPSPTNPHNYWGGQNFSGEVVRVAWLALLLLFLACFAASKLAAMPSLHHSSPSIKTLSDAQMTMVITHHLPIFSTCFVLSLLSTALSTHLYSGNFFILGKILVMKFAFFSSLFLGFWFWVR